MINIELREISVGVNFCFCSLLSVKAVQKLLFEQRHQSHQSFPTVSSHNLRSIHIPDDH